MNDKTYDVTLLLEKATVIARSLIRKGVLEEAEGNNIVQCLEGVRNRLYSARYMSNSPMGPDIDKIDEIMLSLENILNEAARKKYKYTIVRILKTLIYGAGIGHRILTEEEKQDEVYVLMTRRNKVIQSMECIRDTWKLDEKISVLEQLIREKEQLQEELLEYEEKIQQMRNETDAAYEISYCTNVDRLSDDALAYIDLLTAMATIKSKLEEKTRQIASSTQIIQADMRFLNLGGSTAEEEELEAEELETEETETGETETEETETEDTLTGEVTLEDIELVDMDLDGEDVELVDQEDDLDEDSEEDMDAEVEEINEILGPYAQGDGSQFSNLRHKALKRIFSSREMHDYVSDALTEYESIEEVDAEELDEE